MSFEEKGIWLTGLITVVLPMIYFATLIGQLSGTPVTDIDYQPRLLAAIGAAVVLAIVGMIGIGIAAPRDAGKADQRDKDINRLGEYAGGIILAIGMIVPFGLAMVEAAHFWIANAMYLAFVISSISSSAVKLVLYRRGF